MENCGVQTLSKNRFFLSVRQGRRTVHAQAPEIGVLRPGRSHIQAVFAPMAEEEGDIGLLSVVVWAFLAQCDHFLNKIEFVKDLSLRTKTCDKFFSQFLAEIVQR